MKQNRKHRPRRRSMRHRAFLMVLCAVALVAAVGFIMMKPNTALNSTLILVNKEHRLPADYRPQDLVKVNVDFVSSAQSDRRQMRAEAAAALEKLFEAAEDEGLTLLGVSGFRSYSAQRSIYNSRLKEAGLEHVSRYIAEAGASEHQTGLAMDVTTTGVSMLTEEFAQTDEYRWLRENAHHYGFIIRYLAETEGETGYAFEPWHLRYVGDEAPQIAASHQTLEAFLQINYPDLRFVEAPQKAIPASN